MQQVLGNRAHFARRPTSDSHRYESREQQPILVHRHECNLTKRFESFALDMVNQCLVRRQGGADEERISLTPRAYELLRYFVEHPNRLVTQEELLEALWPEAYVQPEVLKNHVLEIRRALGDDHKNPRYIETLPKRGYRFLPEIDEPLVATGGGEKRLSKLIGRSVELNNLLTYQNRSLRGIREVVFVTGESGIGKTALVDQLATEAGANVPKLRIARAQCVERYEGIEPYYPILEALRQLCTGPESSMPIETLAVQAPTWLVHLPVLVKREHGEILKREIAGATRVHMLREICDALETMATHDPLLLILEDLHWADASTVDFLSTVARRRSTAKLMIVGTYAPGTAMSSSQCLRMVKQDLQVRRLCREIPLPPLAETHVAEYLSAELESLNTPAGLAELLHRHSEGNPLFMVAGVEHLTEQKILEKQGERWILKRPVEEIDHLAPDNLRQMLELRIEQLSPERINVLEIVSLKLKFPLPVILGSQVTGMQSEDFERVCEELVRLRYLVRDVTPESRHTVPPPCYRFQHQLYKKIVYGRIPPARKKKLHLSLGLRGAELHLTIDEPETELAYQFEQGGDYARAIDYLIIASKKAAQRFESEQSAAILEHAMNLVREIPQSDRGPVENEVSQRLVTMRLALRNSNSAES